MSKYDVTPTSYKSKSNTAVLVLHGLSASSQQMYFITNTLIKKNYSVFCPNLKGHGTTIDDLDKTKYIEWTDQVKEYYLELKNNYKYIFIVGHSLGGLLGLNLLTDYDISGIIVINAALWYYGLSKSILLTPIFKYFMKHSVNPRIFIKDEKSIDKFTYKKTSVSASAECLKLTMQLRKKINKVKSPALIFKSTEDTFLLKNHKQIFNNISSKIKKLILLKNSYHDAILDHDKYIIIEKVISFIEGIKNGNGY